MASTTTLPARPGRRILRWIGLGLLLLLALILAALALGAGYQAWATLRDRRAYPPPGRLVDVGGHKLHIFCQGTGTPTVVLDALGDGTSVYWARVQPLLAEQTRVCAYDRAGRGWSEPGPAPRDGATLAAELHALLQAGEPGPYVLAGHSYGAMIARLYTDAYPDEVVGVVLVDGGTTAIRSERFPAEARALVASEMQFMRMAPWLARFSLFRWAGNPPPPLPPEQQAIAAAHYGATALWSSLLAEALDAPQTDAQVNATGGLGDRPLGIVLGTGAWLTPGAPTDEARRVFNELHGELQTLSTNSALWVIDGAGHVSLVADPVYAEQTAAAIHAVVEAARTGAAMEEE